MDRRTHGRRACVCLAVVGAVVVCHGGRPAVGRAAPPEGLSSRWFDLQAAALGVRYRYIDNSERAVTQRQGQFSNAYRARIKFDRDARYTLNAGVSTGPTLTGGWNNTGLGTGTGSASLFLKQLYLTARPVRGVELQYGSMGVVRGASTEITSYDTDIYLTGQRLSLKRPENLFLDELAVTYAYLGDAATPGVAKRWRRLGQANHHQFFAAKKWGPRAAFSADYTFQSGVETLREGVRVDTKGLAFVDAVRLEGYQRLDVKAAQGFAVTVEKALSSRLALAPGFATIDADYGGLNGDRFNRGKRVFLNASLSLTPELSFITFYTHALSNDFAVSNRTRLDLILNLDVAKALQRPAFRGRRH